MENQNTSLDNITFRRNRIIKSLPSTDSLNLSYGSTTSSQHSIGSQDLEGTDRNDTELLREQIEKLSNDLQSAHNEIQILSKENNELKQQTMEQQLIITQFKDVYGSPNPKNCTQKKKHKKKSTKSPQAENVPLDNIIVEKDNNNCNNTLPGETIICTTEKETQTYTPGAQQSDYKDPSRSAHNKQNIIILGDQQARGLCKNMIQRRQNKWNDKYNITSIIKPNATSTQILSSCNDDFLEQLTPNDIIVLILGSNDKQPYTFMTEICNALYKLRSHTVFVTNIQYNPYLNKNMLNNNLELLTQKYHNCKYLKIYNSYKYYINRYPTLTHREKYVLYLAQKLSIEIDYQQYYNEFLSKYKDKYINRKHHNTQRQNTTANTLTNLTQTKITNYFKKVTKVSESKNTRLFRKTN
ncbi:hypothetical protein RR48_00730 [Papilio machaon]|uniref:Uncharacterized protein n=1 Tax=Papilio machaon TaxID=76193 RepID=A0A0N1PIU9_PAPMA|nr:hypothetical protein RR48_00730 [Papilio machaon]